MKKTTRTSKAQLSILEILKKARGRHLRAEEIWEALRSGGHDIHLSTVYRSLQSMTASGMIKRNFLQENHAHYEMSGTPGIHLVCSGCGQVQEIGSTKGGGFIETLEKQLRDRFTVLDWQMQIIGKCSKCTSTGKQRRSHER
jgi:Fur family ferric uptake transcriptional regulator